ncbi:MAG: hypothetical protein DWQ19_11110 [Crenarchaeota archaeon]|nr:MAG: hypothetical protein DWQ19_11110 [Thermoproteota archaeon]
MAKSKQKSLLDDIQKETGGQSLKLAGEVPYYINTGNLSLNYICSGKFITGGIPGGRITECYGPPASAKSLWGYSCLGSVQRIGGIGVLLDCERASGAEFASTAGHVNCDELIVYEPNCYEHLEAKVKVATKAIRKHYGLDKPILFVLDSIGVVSCEREWKELDLPENPTATDIKNAGGNQRPGERAKAAGDFLRKINPFLNEQNATMFVINQTRNAIGVMFGSPEIPAGGGEALKFYASCRLRTSVGKYIETKGGLPLGINLNFANKKSRSFIPGLKTTGVQLFFQEGVNPLGGLLSILLQSGRIELSGRGRYKVLEPWADGKEYVFTSSQARNDVPLDLLLETPKVVDAKNQEEVLEWLKPYEGAIKLATGDDLVEKQADEDPEFISELKSEEE